MEENMKHQTKIFGVKPIQELKEERMKQIRGGVGTEDPQKDSEQSSEPINVVLEGNDHHGVRIVPVG
jgi:hypothetical protein